MTESPFKSTVFDLSDDVCVVTGALGLLGRMHCEALRSAGGNIVLIDKLDVDELNQDSRDFISQNRMSYFACDITDERQVESVGRDIIERVGCPRVLVNNAANNPKMSGLSSGLEERLETFPISRWNDDIAVGLTGALLCARVFGAAMATNGGGVIINIASDLALIAPNQRLYTKEGLEESLQPTKPVSYSVVKAGLIGLTRYLSTYWATKNVRCNALAPGGVRESQDENFVRRLEDLIPLGRMADIDEYKGTLIYLASAASQYMNGAVVVCDGGRTAW